MRPMHLLAVVAEVDLQHRAAAELAGMDRVAGLGLDCQRRPFRRCPRARQLDPRGRSSRCDGRLLPATVTKRLQRASRTNT